MTRATPQPDVVPPAPRAGDLLEPDVAAAEALAAGGAASVPTTATVERAAAVLAGSGGPAIVAIGPAGEYAGVVSAERLVGVLIREHDEDLARLGGYRSSAGRVGARPRSGSPGGSGIACPGC